jgi:hypothetical protein
MLLARRLHRPLNLIEFSDAYALRFERLQGTSSINPSYLRYDVQGGAAFPVRSSFALECWVYPYQSITGADHLFTYLLNNADAFRLFCTSTGLRFQWWDIDGTISVFNLPGSLIINAWNYVAISFTPGIEIIGKLNGNQTSYTTAIKIGIRNSGLTTWQEFSKMGWACPMDVNSYSFPGYISHARLYNAALTTNEMAASYSAGRVWHNLNHANLYRYHACNQMNGIPVKDYSTFDIAGRIHNPAPGTTDKGGYHWQNVSSL